MTTLSHSDIVNQLKDQYQGGSVYGGEACLLHAGLTLRNNGFMGSANVVFLTSKDVIIHEAPGCIAAPLVNMVAKNAISLGMAGQGSEPVPVRLYAPERLTMTTTHLSIGDLNILEAPRFGFVFCKKLTLSKSTEEEPEYFEIVKSWAINDDMETEVITRPPLNPPPATNSNAEQTV